MAEAGVSEMGDWRTVINDNLGGWYNRSKGIWIAEHPHLDGLSGYNLRLELDKLAEEYHPHHSIKMLVPKPIKSGANKGGTE